MNRIGLTLAGALLAVAQTPAAAQTATAALGPAEAVAQAAKAPDGQVAGVFDMVVGSTGAAGFQVYLNSARDYHDPANFTIELDPGPRNKLKDQIGGEPQELMTGRHIRVTGTARRIAVHGRDGSTSYQTRVKVERNDQIALVD